jgi:hypothetical protein
MFAWLLGAAKDDLADEVAELREEVSALIRQREAERHSAAIVERELHDHAKRADGLNDVLGLIRKKLAPGAVGWPAVVEAAKQWVARCKSLEQQLASNRQLLDAAADQAKGRQEAKERLQRVHEETCREFDAMKALIKSLCEDVALHRGQMPGQATISEVLPAFKELRRRADDYCRDLIDLRVRLAEANVAREEMEKQARVDKCNVEQLTADLEAAEQLAAEADRSRHAAAFAQAGLIHDIREVLAKHAPVPSLADAGELLRGVVDALPAHAGVAVIEGSP